ncbi:MAG: hypothetical protein PF693_06075 [Spirochaetia bacterium]|jgi:threonine/homoserine/homoserine lactone efflux protein|nr:hypothetical protein [Spirochaetia bacterium]
MKAHSEIPKTLKAWFVVHFIADTLFAIPLFVAPVFLLKLLNWQSVDPLMARMVAAALFGIGIESLLCIKLGRDAFIAMLNLKIIWSFAAIAGFIIGLSQGLFGYTLVGVALLIIFTAFNILWIYWRLYFKKLDRIT